MNEVRSNILSALADIGASVKVASKRAAAADAPTDHPVGSADGGDSPATEGSFSAINEADAKATGGPNSVEAATEETVNPMKKQDNLPAQSELNPGTADDAPPEEIKPKRTVESGDDDSDAGELGGNNEGSGEAEGNISGVGGPKFDGKSASALAACDSWLKKASAIVPVVVKNAPAAKVASAEGITEEDAETLSGYEKLAAAQIAQVLAEAGVSDDAPIEVKRAALVRKIHAQGERAADGFLVTLDEQVLKQALDGTFQKVAQDDPSAAMPPIPGGAPTDPAAGGGDPPMDPTQGGTPPMDPTQGGEGGGEQPNPEQILQEIVAALEAQEITIEEAVQLLTELGAPPEIIQALQQQFGGGGGSPGGPDGAPIDPAMAAAGGAPDPAAAGPEAAAEDVAVV